MPALPPPLLACPATGVEGFAWPGELGRDLQAARCCCTKLTPSGPPPGRPVSIEPVGCNRSHSSCSVLYLREPELRALFIKERKHRSCLGPQPEPGPDLLTLPAKGTQLPMAHSLKLLSSSRLKTEMQKIGHIG